MRIAAYRRGNSFGRLDSKVGSKRRKEKDSNQVTESESKEVAATLAAHLSQLTTLTFLDLRQVYKSSIVVSSA